MALDTDWRSAQSADHAAFGGIRIGMLANASGPYNGGTIAYQRKTVSRGENKPNYHLRRVPARTNRRGALAQPSGAGPSVGPRRNEPSRGRARGRGARGSGRGFQSRDLVRGPNAAFESTIPQTHASRTRESTRTVALRIRGANPFGVASGGVVGAGNQLITLYTDIWFRQQRILERNANILSVGRRGAAATRPLPLRGATNRTGAASTRPFVPAPGVAAPGQQPARAPAGEPASAPGQVASPNVSPIPKPSPLARPAARPLAATPLVRVNWDPMRMLQNALAPVANYARATAQAAQRVAARLTGAQVVNPLPTTLTRQGSPSALAPVLTPSNSAMLGLQPQPQPRPAKCPPCEKKRRTEPTCRNPVVSRRVRGDLVTITRRMQCPPSKSRRP